MVDGDPSEPTTVLVVTADSAHAAAAEEQLGRHGQFQVTTAETMETALERYHSAEPSCIVSDYTLPEADGLALLGAVRTQDPELPFFVCTDGDEEAARRAVAAGVTDHFDHRREREEWDTLAALVSDAVSYYRSRTGETESEERARLLLDAAEETIAIVRDREYQFVNAAGTGLFGAATREELLGESVTDTIEAEPSEYLPNVGALATEETTVRRLETQVRTLDGTFVPVSLTATTVEWDGEPAVTFVLRDLSDRREREQELLLKTRAMDGAPVGITIADVSAPDQPLIYANEGFKRVTGYPGSEIIGRNCQFLQGPDTASQPVAAMREAIDAEEPVTVELRNYRKDGSEFWNRVTITPIRNDAGEVTHYLGFQEEVSERKATEADLRRFERAVEAAGHGIFITDADGRIEYVNEAFEEITGYDYEEAVGSDPGLLAAGTADDEGDESVWSELSPGEVWEEETVNRHKSGRLYHVHQTVAPITNQHDEIEAFVGIKTDVTEQVEREQHLAVLERVLRHNLRNDINVMMSRAELIAEGMADDPAASARRIIERGQQLVEMADKERSVTSLLSQPPELTGCDLTAVLDRATGVVQEQYPDATVSLSVPAGPLPVSAVLEIDQAVVELLENAIEHTSSAPPSVTVTVETGPDTVDLYVADEGPAIPEMERQIITGDIETDDLTHGSGIGLWLINSIVTRSGGSLDFESHGPDGNVVRVRLQRSPEDAKDALDTAGEDGDGMDDGDDDGTTP